MLSSRQDQPSSLKDQMALFKQTMLGRQKYVKKEFQAYGLELAKELRDWKNRSLYIRLAKTTNRQVLETARAFVKDQTPGTIKTPYKLFMWKLKQLKNNS